MMPESMTTTLLRLPDARETRRLRDVTSAYRGERGHVMDEPVIRVSGESEWNCECEPGITGQY